jgi:hypothetical protein
MRIEICTVKAQCERNQSILDLLTIFLSCHFFLWRKACARATPFRLFNCNSIYTVRYKYNLYTKFHAHSTHLPDPPYVKEIGETGAELELLSGRAVPSATQKCDTKRAAVLYGQYYQYYQQYCS